MILPSVLAHSCSLVYFISFGNSIICSSPFCFWLSPCGYSDGSLCIKRGLHNPCPFYLASYLNPQFRADRCKGGLYITHANTPAEGGGHCPACYIADNPVICNDIMVAARYALLCHLETNESSIYALPRLFFQLILADKMSLVKLYKPAQACLKRSCIFVKLISIKREAHL